MTKLDQASLHDLHTTYKSNGFVRVEGLFDEIELAQLHEVLIRFHKAWQLENPQLYQTRAINSAYLTDENHMGIADRRVLFRILGDRRIGEVLRAIFTGPAAFMNTQLFFNPFNSDQHNYWHRDIQYSGDPELIQREALMNTQVLHLRLALMPEHGLELVPGSHRRWDTQAEYAVRMAQGRSTVHDAIADAQCVPLARGDLLIFSANMLHRGIYGAERFAFDMLFSDPLVPLLKYVRPSCLPSGEDFAVIANPDPFLKTRQVLEKAGLIHLTKPDQG